jgi:hypothetical protein
MVTHTCSICLKIFNKKYNYDIHTNKKKKCKQVIINPFQCIHCNCVFDFQNSLEFHIKYNCRFINNNSELLCIHCNILCNSQTSLEFHIRNNCVSNSLLEKNKILRKQNIGLQFKIDMS